MRDRNARKGSRLSPFRNRPGEFIVAGIPMFGWILLGAFPLAMSLIISFTDLRVPILTQMKPVGFSNYWKILTDGEILGPILTTAVFTLNLPIKILGALFIAHQLTKMKIGKRFFSAVVFIPCVCSVVAVALTFRIIFRDEGGVLNSVLNFFGFKSFGWLTDSPWAFMGSTIFMALWMGMGSNIILYRAALSGVDKSYYEAAKLDGATDRQIFWKITWPAVSPVTGFMVTTGLIGSLQVMGELMVIQPPAGWGMYWWEGAEFWVSDSISRYIYNMIFVNSIAYGYGMAAAAGWLFALVILLLSRVNLKAQERWVNYDF